MDIHETSGASEGQEDGRRAGGLVGRVKRVSEGDQRRNVDVIMSRTSHVVSPTRVSPDIGTMPRDRSPGTAAATGISSVRPRLPSPSPAVACYSARLLRGIPRLSYPRHPSGCGGGERWLLLRASCCRCRVITAPAGGRPVPVQRPRVGF